MTDNATLGYAGETHVHSTSMPPRLPASLADLLGECRSALDISLTATIFDDLTGKHLHQRLTTTREMDAWVHSSSAATKPALRLLKLAAFGDIPTSKGSYRHDANITSIYGIELDYDGGETRVEEAAARLHAARVAGLIYTSPGHTPEKPRFRIICPVSAPLPLKYRARLCARVNGVFGGKLAPESFTGSQAYFYGVVNGAPAPERRLIDGRAIDEATDLDAGALDRNGQPYSDRSEPQTKAAQVSGDDDTDDYELEADIDRLTSAVAAIPIVEAGYDLWLRVGMALHGETRGSDAGREIWDTWSAAGETYDDREIPKKWKSFASRTSGPRVKAGTLYHLAMQHGWNAADVTTDEIDPIDAIGAAGAAHTPASIDPITARLNKRHCVIRHKGATMIGSYNDDKSVDYGTVRALHDFYANDRVRIIGSIRSRAVSEDWMCNPHRSTFANGVAFAPGGCGPGVLNLWQGWAVEPDSTASCQLFLSHLLLVVCSGNAEHYDYVVGWLAHIVQQPDQKPGVALVLKGAKGAGKDTVAEYMTELIGRRHVPSVANPEHVVGRFNARLETALLLHIEEGSWAGDQKSEGVLKNLVTTPNIHIERKGIDSFSMVSVVRVFISANADWVVPASADERRWAVFNVSDVRCRDTAYFDALHAEMRGSGPAALLHYLMQYDLTGFDVRRAPETTGLRDQKIESLRGVEAWWHGVLQAGDLSVSGFELNDSWETTGITVDRAALRGKYVEWVRGRRYGGEALEPAQFGRKLRELVQSLGESRPRLSEGGSRRVYIIPSLGDCRASFTSWLGSAPTWDE